MGDCKGLTRVQEAKVEQQRALKCEVDDMKLKLEARRTAKAAQLPEIKEVSQRSTATE